MSSTIKFAAAALLAGLAASFGSGPAAAGQSCDGTVQLYPGGVVQCYYLPTVSNGRVTGLQEHINFSLNRGNSTPRGAIIGGGGGSNCRNVPIVIGGHTINHVVCS
jgi:hypothetical protein